MPNDNLLKKTVEEIEEEKFAWDQRDWNRSKIVYQNSNIPFDKLHNECGTTHCFAGRVASLNREMLFRDLSWGGVIASEFFISVEGDPSDLFKPQATLYRAVEGKDGITIFEAYEGDVISARTAAIHDLSITNIHASALFDEYNDLNKIKDIIDRIIDGDSMIDYDDDEEDLEELDEEYY